MTNTQNPFATAYPSSRGPLGKVFRPVVDFRTYLRAAHMLLMFPLGIGYFVFFVVTFAVGGSLIWTIVGPVVLIPTLFISRWLGDLEAFITSRVTGASIRRPPSRIEGVSNVRSQIKVRLIDPTTWTGLFYLVAQFPIGIAAFVSLVVVYAVSGAFTFAPVIQMFSDDALEFGTIFGYTPDISTPTEALQLTPIGILGFFVASHLIIVFSSIHGWWASLMLGSRSSRVSSRLAPTTTGDDTLRPGRVVTDLADEAGADRESGASVRTESPAPSMPTPIIPLRPAIAAVPPPVLTLLSDPPEMAHEDAPNTAAIGELTAREQEVFMLMAHGDTNADIAEELFISEGTVKTHVKRVFSKLEMRDRAQLVVFAYEHRLVVPQASGASASPEVARSRLASGG
ncbi:MAG: sensor domain-containing protein [Chloroflexi bacterium]|nr:sensor domain-containing protein [Chloroflexota bacterium]